MPSSTSFRSSALYVVILLAEPSVHAFTSTQIKQSSSSQLFYRSIHHGPDVEPLTEAEKLGAEYTKMSKNLIKNYGPGVLDGFADFNDQFDGGDSEMGLTGDGTVGLQKLGRDVTPHMARTMGAITRGYEPHEEIAVSQNMGYAEELMHSNPTMDSVRAQQLENWAEQREISLSNKYMYYDRTHESYDVNINAHEEESFFSSQPVEAGGEYEGVISLRAPLHGVAQHDIALKNPYMGFAAFRTGFVGDVSNDWFVTPSDGVLKQNRDTYFSVTFRPKHPGVSSGYLVIETPDFKKTWKVVGSTGDQYEF